MLKIAKYFYHNTRLGNSLFNAVFNMHHKYRIYCIEETKFLKANYKKHFNEYPDFENPKRLNEKIIWLKLNDRTPLHTQCADKYAVRAYVKEVIGELYLIPLIFKSKNSLDLIPSNFPIDKPFIIKTNHDSSGGIIVKNRDDVNWKSIQKTIKKQLKTNYFYPTKEWQYLNIKPLIIAEKLLVSKTGEIPFDYKFHCFGGKVEVVQVDIDRFTNHRRNLYNVDWKLLPFTWSNWKDGKPLWENGKDLPKPKCLEKMIRIVEKIALPFVYVRVDMYDFEGKIYFGEITFHHGSGYERLDPMEWDYKLGDLVDLTKLTQKKEREIVFT